MKCKCKAAKDYNEEFDTYYCKQCDVWLEGICSDELCEFCSARPLRPSDAI